MFDRLVVGLDGSPASIGALEWAAAEAQLRGAELSAIGCVLGPVLLPLWPAGEIPVYDVDAAQDYAETELERIVARIALTNPQLRIRSTVKLGRTVDVLSDESKSADLLVIATTGTGRVEHLLLGSTAHGLARTSACPLAVIPLREQPPNAGRIVVGIDGSEHSDAALDWAIDEARRRETELVVIHVWFYPYAAAEFCAPEMRDRTRVDASLVLGEAVDRCRDRTTTPVRGELVEDSAAPGLLDAAAGADLLVVGSRGRSRLRTALFGSVARTVAEHAPCPVVIVRPPAG